MRNQLLVAIFAVLLFGSPSLFAQVAAPQSADLAAIRAQIDAMKADYEKKIQDLQKQLDDIQARQSTPSPAAAAPQALAQTPSSSVVGGSVSNGKVFNPDISVIGDFLGAAGSNQVNPSPVMEMHESEVAFQAVVDPYARADFFISFGEEGVNLEEGYLTFPALPGGLLVKVGKMRAAFGKVNTLHNHVMPWTDRPLVTTNLVGGEDGIDDTGFSVARLIPNKLIFLEATGQAFEGTSGNGLYTSSQRSDLTYVGHLRAYKDITDNTNLDFGFSISHGHNASGVVNGDDVGRFTTQLYGGDATIRWKPLQRSVYHSFVGRSEFVWSSRNQPNGTQDAKGFFVSADYQLARRWYLGGRYDRSGRPDAASVTDSGQSLILSYFPSEFSQIRGQYRRTDYGVGPTANEFLFQFQFAIGAHGAHPF
jgi:hypothetical protein